VGWGVVERRGEGSFVSSGLELIRWFRAWRGRLMR
jgi:hypothetical protein